MKVFSVLPTLLLTILAAANVSASDLISGSYRTNNESFFNFDLKLENGGKASWREMDDEGGKPFVMSGTWTAKDDTVEVVFPKKKGRYAYKVVKNLSWQQFGCKGSSVGLQITAVPAKNEVNEKYNVWLSKDLKRAEKCQRV